MKSTTFLVDCNQLVSLLASNKNFLASLNDLWCFDLPTRTWTQLPVSGPGPMYLHQSVVIGSNLYIIHGHTGQTWKYDTISTAWTALATAPSTSDTISLVYSKARGEIIVYATGAIWAYDWANNAWRRVTPLGTSPVGRDYVETVILDRTNEMFLFGGETASTSYNDIWKLNLNTFRWTQVTGITGTSPNIRSRGCMVLTSREEIVLYGGLPA